MTSEHPARIEFPGLRRRAACWLSAVLALVAGPALPIVARAGGQSDDPSFYLQMRDGGIIQASSAEQAIVWKSVAIDGEVTRSDIQLSQIRSLQLAETPASVQVAEIRRLVNELADDDYHKRHLAEQQLGVEGLPFVTIIEQFRNHSEPEARYRIARVLKRLKTETDNSQVPAVIQFDRLETLDGRTLEGDIGDWSFRGTWRNYPVEGNRGNCSGLAVDSPVRLDATPPDASRPIRVNPVISADHFIDDTAPRPGIRMATFETGNNDVTLVKEIKEPVEQMFSFLGCLLRCETENGNVIISGYKFKKGISRLNSVSNLYRDPESGKMTRYSGVMRIEFCLPGQPMIPAGVTAAGLGTEIVAPEHTVVQAWNSAGHVVGLTWSASERNSFMGFDSNTEIAWLTVSANEFLQVDKLNRDFAVDDLCFTQPLFYADVVHPDPGASLSAIVTRDGNRVLARSVAFSPDGQSVEANVTTGAAGSVSIPVADIRSITGHYPESAATESLPGLSVMTQDGSVLHVNPAGLTAVDSPDQVLPAGEVIGYWKPDQPARYPNPDDFRHGSLVVVQPLERVALDGVIDWTAGTVDFDLTNGKTIRQSPGPGGDPFEISEAIPAGIRRAGAGAHPVTDFSNVWLAPPVNRASGTGLLRTADGQQFVLGGSSGFQLQELQGDRVSVGRAGHSLAFSMADVVVLQFPEP